MLKETTFVMQHHMKVSHDPAPIDEAEPPEDAWTWHELDELEKCRFHRMYEAIINNSKALYRVLLYRAISEHDLMVEGGEYGLGESYAKSTFHTETFAGLLLQITGCFSPEDREWLQELTQGYKEAQAQYQRMREGDEECTDEEKEAVHKRIDHVDTMLSALERCFNVEYDGWNCAEDKSAHKHMGEP